MWLIVSPENGKGGLMKLGRELCCAAFVVLVVCAHAAAQQTGGRIPTAVVLVNDLMVPGADAIIVRRSVGSPKDAIVVKRSAATAELFLSASNILSISRDLVGDSITGPDLILRASLDSNRTFNPRELDMADRTLQRLLQKTLSDPGDGLGSGARAVVLLPDRAMRAARK